MTTTIADKAKLDLKAQLPVLSLRWIVTLWGHLLQNLGAENIGKSKIGPDLIAPAMGNSSLVLCILMKLLLGREALEQLVSDFVFFFLLRS